MNGPSNKLPQSAFRITPKTTRRPKPLEFVISFLVTIAGLYIYYGVMSGAKLPGAPIFGFVQNVELKSLDSLFKSRGPRPPDSRIAIVDIDEQTLRKVGAWPIPRNAYAKMIDRLHDAGAKVVAFDVNFPTPEKNSAISTLKELESQAGHDPKLQEKIRAIEETSDNDKILAASFKQAGNVILGHSFLDPDSASTIPIPQQEEYYNVLWGKPFSQVHAIGSGFKLTDAFQRAEGRVAEGVFPNIGLLAEAANSYGYYDETLDADGSVRRAILILWYHDRDFFTSLPVQALTLSEGIDIQDQHAYIGSNGVHHLEFGKHIVPTALDGTALINYAGPYRTYPHYSMADVIDGSVAESTFKDKVVFLGATAKGIGDLRSTPFQTQDQGYMGVEIHANVLDNLLHSDDPRRTFIHRGDAQHVIDIAFILFFGLGMSWVFSTLRPLHAAFAMIAALGIFMLAVRFAFVQYGVWLFVIVPTTTLLLDYGAITTYRMIFEEREKRKVRKTFERYVAPSVIHLIEQEPEKYFKTGGEIRDMSIMFSDIRSFTTIAEGMTADELVHVLNEYLGAMTDILFDHWGTLDKYIGDALMAFWNSPYPVEEHALRACGCALAMSERLEKLNEYWEAQGKKRLEIGIGINTGPVNVGNMGCDKRFSWTVMGDHVNLASRLEGQNKIYHTCRIVSEFTFLEAKGAYVFRPLDRIRVKGKVKPVGIYELLGYAIDAPAYDEMLTMWTDAQDAYYRQAWDEAIQRFEALLSKHPDDGPSHAFLKRCHDYRAQSPEQGWDGVYIAKEK